MYREEIEAVCDEFCGDNIYHVLKAKLLSDIRPKYADLYHKTGVLFDEAGSDSIKQAIEGEAAMPDYAELILSGENPFIRFANTYEMHRQLRVVGVEIMGAGGRSRVPQRVTRELHYRVDHGDGYATQQSWYPGDAVPTSRDIEFPNEVSI